MNKAELIDALAQRANMPKKNARAAVDALFDPSGGVIAGSLKTGERVAMAGFGTFETRRRGERTARNPRTGQTIRLAATDAPAFRPGKGLKETVKR